MIIIRTIDLNDAKIPEALFLMWKLQHSIWNIQIKINKNNLMVEKMTQYFGLSKNEILILKCILWAERITANGISSYLLIQKSNVLKLIKGLIKKEVLRILKDGTYNVTKEFYKKWTIFINSSKLLESSLESYYEIETELLNLIKLFKVVKSKIH